MERTHIKIIHRQFYEVHIHENWFVAHWKEICVEIALTKLNEVSFVLLVN